MGKAPAVVLVNPKTGFNVATTLRTCAVLGISQLWITGERWSEGWERRMPREERMRLYGKIQVFRCDEPLRAFGKGITPVVVEYDPTAQPLATFTHPEKPVWVFGPEDGSVPDSLRRNSHQFVVMPTDSCLNLGVAVGCMLMDWKLQRQRAGLDEIKAAYDTAQDNRSFSLALAGEIMSWIPQE